MIKRLCTIIGLSIIISTMLCACRENTNLIDMSTAEKDEYMTITSVVSPDKKIESIELSVPNYQTEYDVDTNIPVDITILPENPENNSLEYVTSGDTISFSDAGITTGSEEGSYEIYVLSDDIKSNIVTINVVDITAREEAMKAEEERLAKEQEEKELTAKEAEEKAAKEKAAKEAEEKAAKELAAKEAEEKAAKELAAKEAEEKAAKEKAVKEAEEKAADVPKTPDESENQSTVIAQATPVEPNSGSTNSANTGAGSNFNTYNNESQQQTTASYVLNTNTHKIHHPACSSVKKIAPQNYATSNDSVDALIAQGYSTCGICFK